jgi:hypothetical protein
MLPPAPPAAALNTVLQALIAQPDHAGAGVVGAARRFQHGQDIGIHAFGIIALRLPLREGSLLQE